MPGNVMLSVMARRPRDSMRITLSPERTDRLLAALSGFHEDLFDAELSDYRARELLSFFVRELGPPIYNQAIQDACAFMNERIADLDAEFYEPDEGSGS